MLEFYLNFIGSPRPPTSEHKAAGVSVSVLSRTVQFEKQWTFNHLRISLLLIKCTYFSQETFKNSRRLCGWALWSAIVVRHNSSENHSSDYMALWGVIRQLKLQYLTVIVKTKCCAIHNVHFTETYFVMATLFPENIKLSRIKWC